MEDYVFIQRGRLGRTIFRMRGDQLDIDVWRFGLRGRSSFALRSLSPDYEIRAVRVHWLYLWPAFVALVAGVIIYLMLSVPFPFRSLVIYPGIFLAVGVAGFVHGLKRVEFFLFSDHWKRPVVQVLREPGETKACDAFVTELIYRIEQSNAGLPILVTPEDSASPRSAVRLPLLPEDSRPAAAGNCWLLAIVCGFLGAAPLAVPPLADRGGEGLLLLMFLLIVAALVYAALSYAQRERHRHRALIGAILALVSLYVVCTAYRALAGA